MNLCRYDIGKPCENHGTSDRTCLDCTLDKIKAELHTTAEMHEDGDYYLRDEWVDEIIDKYRG